VDIDAMTPWERWRHAAKVDSWPKLTVPFLLGQVIGIGDGLPSLGPVLFGLAFTVCDLLFLVFLNDWGDREVDAIKRRMFPEGCSPKTIPDGILPAHHLLFAGIAAGGLGVGVAFAAEVVLDRPGAGLMGTLCLALFVAYTLPPLRLNYRGGGELLEMVGVGVALPLFMAYLQAGSLDLIGLALVPGFAVLALSSAVASGLADERSDRAGGKRTFVTTFGNPAGRGLVQALLVAASVVWLSVGAWSRLPSWVALAPVAVVAFYGLALHRASPAAGTDQFAGQRRFKHHLHQAIWRGGEVAAMALLFFHLYLGRR
jgi:1,4-dihydroxy-2-naphthoate octaprenyltransferase